MQQRHSGFLLSLKRTNDWAPKTTELWSNVRMRQASKGKHSAQWFWKAKNRQKLNSFLCHFTSFSIKFYQIDIYFGIPRTSFILKSCQTVVGIWTVCHFYEFLWSNLWQVFAFWPNCAVVRSTRQQAWRQAERRRLSAAAQFTERREEERKGRVSISWETSAVYGWVEGSPCCTMG